MIKLANQDLISVPEPSLTPDEMVARAAGLRNLLLEKQATAEELGAPDPGVNNALIEAGFYRVVQPRRFGGYEFDLADFARVTIELARGCPSTAWYFSFSAGHALFVAQLFPEEAQHAAFGPSGEFYAPGRLPMGTAVPVDGGWRIKGRWDYCSGARYANYFVPAVLVPPEDDPEAAPSEVAMAIVPRAKWELIDDWRDMLGLRGSSSNSISIDDQVIPARDLVRANFMSVDLSKPPLGYEIHRNPLYGGRLQGAVHTSFAAVSVGAAWAMLDEYERTIKSRKTYFPPIVPRFQHHQYQRIYGQAYGKITTAQTIVVSTAAQHRALAARSVEGGPAFAPAEEMALITQYQNAMELALEAVDMLWRTAGSTATRDDSRMQRYYRDCAMMRTHLSQQYEPFAESFALVRLGLEGQSVRAGQTADQMESRIKKTIDLVEEEAPQQPLAVSGTGRR
ncbi:acyl-CoA dehydrogenase family protein [Sphingobium sp.]|uniref:acyl-CoA dehydrogenase family protein n=1 Tax=Sphingobium sp. TaxID=1912891 RepID=UPI0028BDADB9|nr:acyl-CoA dehydrogenase family protein [Sphingobium sp.]